MEEPTSSKISKDDAPGFIDPRLPFSFDPRGSAEPPLYKNKRVLKDI